MSEEEIQVLTSEMADLDIALIFLNEGKQRTINLKNDSAKHGFPDLNNRIARIQASINRFQPRADNIRARLRVEEKMTADKKAIEKTADALTPTA